VKTITLDELKAQVGQESGLSPWREVTQTMIDQFADATDDHQFIHCDPARAAAETPFGGTIAHGFLTLSLLSTFAFETAPKLEGADMGINHGFDQVRFVAPVKPGRAYGRVSSWRTSRCGPPAGSRLPTTSPSRSKVLPSRH
jgi:acyl dehydratase